MPAQPQAPGQRALRRGRISLSGQLYHITSVTHERAAIFSGHQAASAACRRLSAPEVLNGSNLLCWVLMPDHLHMLLQLGESQNLPALVKRIKSATAREINKALERQGQVWAHGFHDHALRREEDIQVIARYIVANPLRAGLVRNIGDYPYWNAIWL